MNERVDAVRSLFTPVLELLREGTTAAASFMPRLLGALAILAVGFLAARLVRALTQWSLRRLGLDGWIARSRLRGLFQARDGVVAPSRLAGHAIFLAVFALFALTAIDALGFDGLRSALERIAAFLPSLAAAAVILTLGLLLARWIRGFIEVSAAAAGLTRDRSLAALVHGAVTLVAVLAALEELGVETEMVVNLLAIALAGIVLTGGMAIALGARPVISHILAGHFVRQNLPSGRVVEVRGQRGVVEQVGAVDTLLRDGDRSWSIPNAQLLEEIVTR